MITYHHARTYTIWDSGYTEDGRVVTLFSDIGGVIASERGRGHLVQVCNRVIVQSIRWSFCYVPARSIFLVWDLCFSYLATAVNGSANEHPATGRELDSSHHTLAYSIGNYFWGKSEHMMVWPQRQGYDSFPLDFRRLIAPKVVSGGESRSAPPNMQFHSIKDSLLVSLVFFSLALRLEK